MSTTTAADSTSEASELALTTENEDLLKAVVALKQLQKENKKLTSNFDNLKAIHLGLLNNYKQLESSHHSLKQERVAVEQQYQQLCEAWKAELDEKQRQFEQARAQILEPSDLGLLRAQLLEEVEAPYKAKCEAIAKEAESAQRQYVQLRREHEALQNRINSQEIQQRSELNELRAQQAAVQQTLSSKLDTLEAAQGRVQQLEQQLRQAQQQKQEAELRLHFATEEAQELRLAKEAAVVEKEQVAVRSERRSQAHEVELSELRCLVESLTRKNRHLMEELSEANRAQDTAHTQLLGLQATNASLASQLADVQAAAAREKQLLQDKAASAEQLWQQRNKELLEQVLQKERQVAQLTLSEQAALRQAESAANAQVAEVEAAAAGRQREAAAKIADLMSRLEAAESSAAELSAQLLHVQNQGRLEITAARNEAEQLQAHLDHNQQLVHRLQQQLSDAMAQQQMLRSSFQQIEAVSDTGRAAKAEARCTQLEALVEKLQVEASEARSQLNSLVRAHEQLRAETDKRVAAAKQTAAAERDVIQARHSAKVKKLQEAAKDQIRTLRSKLKDSRSTVEQLTTELSSLKISMHEREADLAAVALRSSIERPASVLGSPAARMHLQHSDTEAASPGRWQTGLGLATSSPSRAATLAAAFVGVRQRQQRYLHDAGQTAAGAD